MSTTTAKPLKMSDTALKFGPEWLRALSHGDTAVSPPPSPSLGAPRYKLADHRYGREEMLALFDKMMKAPDDLVIAPPLYVEKTQLPLALVQMTDEEMRMWQRGVNSDVVLKLMGRSTGGGPSVASGGPPGPVAARGRGGSMDRGRGRGRGLGSAVGAYNRGTSYEEDVGEHGRREGGPPTGYGRGARPFERPQNPSERPWVERSERNGGSEEWNGSTSPRKEFGRPFADNNWRSRDAKERERGDSKEEEDGWRTAGRGERWGRSGWRNDRERESEREGGTEKGERFFGKGEREGWEGQGSVQGQNQGGSERDRHRSWDSDNRPAAGGPGSSYYANKRSMQRRGWDDHDTLPEWAAEDMQGGGTFDASGAFRDERWSDEDDVGDERKRSGGDGQQNRVLLEEEAEPSGTVEDQANTHQVESVEVKDGGQAVSKEASVESHSDGTSSMTGEQIVASPGHSAHDKLEDVRAAMDRESGLSMTSVDPVDHHGHRVCEEDGLEHAQAVASTLVAQLVEEEDQPKETLIPNHHIVGMEQWFYRDPQGEVQGPFTCAEMAEWFNSGYFTMALSVRRACDERFVQLGELTKLWGVRLPFLAGHNMPPLKSTDVNPMVAEQEKIHMIQQQLIQQQLFQQQLMQQQQLMMRQQSIVSKLSQMDGWNTLSPVQQQQIVNQHMMPPHATGIVGSDPLLQQLRIQMEAQAKLQAEILHRKDSVQSMVNMQQPQPQPQPPQPQQHPKAPESVLEPVAQMKQDPIQAFVQQLLGQPKGPNLSKSPQLPSKPVELDPIQSLLQQAQWNAAQSGGPNVGNNVDSHTAHIAPGFHGMPPGPGLVPWPPHTLALGMGGLPMAPAMYSHAPTEPPTSVWDLENAANAEENKRMMEQQQQMAEMRRREEEEKRMMEEEERKRREREMQEREEERKRMEQMRREAEARQQAEEMRRRNELERQQMEEKRRREEEKRRKEEEMRQQQAEEERIRREEERIRKEEEKVAEQQRRQQEALQRLQEQQAAAQAQARAQAQAQQAAAAASAQQAPPKNQPSAVAPWAQQQQQQQQQQPSESLSLAEIQKLQEEREMKEKAAAQAQKTEQATRAALLQQQQQQAASKLRWGKQTVSTAAKSLAEIQAEEAAQLARQKEKERVEKASQQVNLNLAAAGAWASHSSSAWSSGRTAAAVVSQNLPPVNHVNSNWKTGSVGFWEDPTPPKPQPASSQPQQSPAPVNKPTPAAASAAPSAAPSSSKGAQQQQQQQQQQPKGTTTNTAASVNKKNRNNKEEETVRKLFGQTTEKKDSFSQWCFEYLKKVQAPIDVPTFVCFLKDVESPFEVQDYVRSYLGEGKEAKEFAKQFLEQRSKLRQLQRSVQQYEEDNMCIPAKAVNPGQASDFHEVKSKSKKSKKKMQKVDASLLGFSVSASTDRINVGERDFVDGM